MITESTKLEDLSPKARALAGLLGKDGNISEALKKDPSLLEGLDEYQKWRDQEQRREGEQIGCNSQHKPVAHGVAETLKKLRPPKKRKK